MDPVNFQRWSEVRQKEYLALVEYERNAKPLRNTLAEAAQKVIARLTALTNTAPTQTVTAPDITEACVDC